MTPKNLWLAAILASGSLVSAHPGESEEVKRQEAQARADYLATLKHTNLAHCAGKLGSKAAVKRTIERRQALAQQLVKRNEASEIFQNRFGPSDYSRPAKAPKPGIYFRQGLREEPPI
jgi:hypothetical protein